MIYVVGGKGLVGSAFVRNLNRKTGEFQIIQRENKEQFWGTECDVLIFANGNSFMYKADDDPSSDFLDSVVSVVEYVHKVKYKRFVLISSGSVYNKHTSLEMTLENTVIDQSCLSNYAYHKFIAEKYVQHFSKNYLIFRLGGLVGPGLKKNPVYDFIHQHKKVMISPDSRLNFIHTDFVAEAVLRLLNVKTIKNECFNLAASNSIKIADIKNLIGNDTEYSEGAHKIIQNYQFNVEKIQKYIEIPTTEESILHYLLQLKH